MQKTLEAIKKGDIDTFGAFFRSHYPRLLSYCKLFVSDESIAEDLVQETFIKFWETREKLDQEKSTESLLFVSLRNRCLNYLRDQKLTSQKLCEYQEATQNLQFITQTDFLGQEESPIEEQLIHELNIALEKLPKRCRDIVTLTKIEGLKNKEVAEKLDISVKAVEKQLAIGKLKIEEHIRKNYAFGLILSLMWFS